MPETTTLDHRALGLPAPGDVTIILPPEKPYSPRHLAPDDPAEVAALTRKPKPQVYQGAPPPLPAFPFLTSRSPLRLRDRVMARLGAR